MSEPRVSAEDLANIRMAFRYRRMVENDYSPEYVAKQLGCSRRHLDSMEIEDSETFNSERGIALLSKYAEFLNFTGGLRQAVRIGAPIKRLEEEYAGKKARAGHALNVLRAADTKRGGSIQSFGEKIGVAVPQVQAVGAATKEAYFWNALKICKALGFEKTIKTGSFTGLLETAKEIEENARAQEYWEDVPPSLKHVLTRAATKEELIRRDEENASSYLKDVLARAAKKEKFSQLFHILPGSTRRAVTDAVELHIEVSLREQLTTVIPAFKGKTPNQLDRMSAHDELIKAIYALSQPLFALFVTPPNEVAPHAEQFDQAQKTLNDVISRLTKQEADTSTVFKAILSVENSAAQLLDQRLEIARNLQIFRKSGDIAPGRS